MVEWEYQDCTVLPLLLLLSRCKNGASEYDVRGCFRFESPAGKKHRLQYHHDHQAVSLLR